jgi:hypothetical protein
MTIQFWSNEPTVLFNKDNMFELWPTTNMCYEQKLNAISRLVILITFLGYILTTSMKILVVGLCTLVGIFALFKMRKQKVTKEMINEGFKNDEVYIQGEGSYVNPSTLESVLKSEFKEGTKKNPFSNVLLTQIGDTPDRKAAPPSFNVDVSEDITKNMKKAVQMLNPEIKDTNKQLFGDLYQEFELDQCSRQFCSTANTRVTNDQGAFSQFLYGDMPSAKGSDFESNLQREKDNSRYLLI